VTPCLVQGVPRHLPIAFHQFHAGQRLLRRQRAIGFAFALHGRGVQIVVRDHPMETARLFQSGRSQAVRLLKEYRFAGTEVMVKHFGNGVLLLPVDDPWQTLEAGWPASSPVLH